MAGTANVIIKSEESTVIVSVLKDAIESDKGLRYQCIADPLIAMVFCAQMLHMCYIASDMFALTINKGIKFFAFAKFVVNTMLLGNMHALTNRMMNGKPEPGSSDASVKLYVTACLHSTKWVNIFFAYDFAFMVSRLFTVCELVETAHEVCMATICLAWIIILLYTSLLVPAELDPVLHRRFKMILPNMQLYHKLVHVFVVPILTFGVISSVGRLDDSVSLILFSLLTLTILGMLYVTVCFHPDYHFIAMVLCGLEIKLLCCLVHQLDVDHSATV